MGGTQWRDFQICITSTFNMKRNRQNHVAHNSRGQLKVE